jgi:hypothetical protein
VQGCDAATTGRWGPCEMSPVLLASAHVALSLRVDSRESDKMTAVWRTPLSCPACNMVPNGASVGAGAVERMSSRSRTCALSDGRAGTLVALSSLCRLEALCVARGASADIGLE